MEKAISARESAAYAEALKALGDGAERDFRIVEGLDAVMGPARGEQLMWLSPDR
jgi:hypothetical protein